MAAINRLKNGLHKPPPFRNSFQRIDKNTSIEIDAPSFQNLCYLHASLSF